MSALARQVGGSHYKGKAIQPIEYITANNLNFIEGTIIKYITRWKEKNGYEDLEKIKHYIDLLIEMDKKYHGAKLQESRRGDIQGIGILPQCVPSPGAEDPFADRGRGVQSLQPGWGSGGVVGSYRQGET